jgi:SnoaL-like domain
LQDRAITREFRCISIFRANIKINVMKKSLLLLSLFLSFYVSAKSQTTKSDDTFNRRISQIEDRIALKELVDTFSILSDKKDVRAQVQLFTTNATVETSRGCVVVTKLKGRKEMEDAFGAFLKNFETVYHFNGQQTVTINGDKASGISYCMVTLIGIENGKKMKTSIGVYYQDEYVREDNRWLIAKRKSVFDWEDKQELGR